MARQKDPLDLLVDAIFDRLFDAEGTGRFGEGLTAGQLKRLSRRLGEGKVLRNVYVPKEGGGTSEIDVLFITSRGVFVIESKNYSGWIFGHEEDRYWTQCLQSGQKNRFYNPVLQNRGHLKWLRRTLGEDVPLYSLVVFSERCELKKVTLTSDDVVVVKREDLGGAVRRIWEAAEGAGPVDVGEAFRRLEPLAHADAQTKADHVEEAQAAAQRAGHRAGLEKETAAGEAAAAAAAGAMGEHAMGGAWPGSGAGRGGLGFGSGFSCLPELRQTPCDSHRQARPERRQAVLWLQRISGLPLHAGDSARGGCRVNRDLRRLSKRPREANAPPLAAMLFHNGGTGKPRRKGKPP